MNICPEGAEFHADGQTDGRTDMTKLIAAFRNFATHTHLKTESCGTFKQIRDWKWKKRSIFECSIIVS